LRIKVKSKNIWRLDLYVFSLRNKVRIVSETKDYFLVEYKLNNPRFFLIRHYPSSDFSVFKSVIIEKQYDLKYNILNEQGQEINIIDTGANVGYTAIYFKDKFPKAKIICIEPSPDNFSMLKKNMENNCFLDIVLQMNAVWYKEVELFFDNNFRDNREHSIRTVESIIDNQTSVNSITFDSVIKNNKIRQVDILKMDIEGAEEGIFKFDKNLPSLLEITKNVAIEIHDEFECRSTIEEMLISHDFVIENWGEITFASK
jgi:FkbM family methyltransferase